MRTETNILTGETTMHVDAPAPMPKTQAEIDAEIEAEKDALVNGMISQNRSIIKAFILCINDGSIVPSSNAALSELKAAIKAKL